MSAGVHLNPARSGGDEQEVQFWSRVMPETLAEMYDIYQLDFEMFGYSIKDYFRGMGLSEKLEALQGDFADLP